MKKLFLMFFLLFSFLCFSQKDIKSYNQRESRKFNFMFSISVELVINKNSYQIFNVRVYEHSENGQVTLVGNQNVQTGKFKKNKTRSKASDNCSSGYFKNDYIIESKNKNKYCLKELFKDIAIYNEYKYIANRLIDEKH